MYSLTIFTGIFDNKTHRRMDFSSWEKFEDLMYSLSKEPGYKPKKDERFHPNASPLISPAVFGKGELRRNVNVKAWAKWCALDIDEYDGTFDDALKSFDDYKFISYSTASSTEEHPKFRVLLPLTRDVMAEEIRHFWFALNQEFNSLGDPQTKDLSRMYYVPAQYPNAYNFIVSNKFKEDLNVDTLLNKYAYAKEKVSTSLSSTLPDSIKSKIEEYKKTKLTNTHFKWNGISDCPFVNTRIIDEYKSISKTGWYRKMFAFFVSIAANALKKGYPISANEIAELGKELDLANGGWYKDRPLEMEAERAIAFVCKAL